MPATRSARRRSRIAQAVDRMPLFDRLEARLFLAAHPTVWQINGTPNDDTIVVGVSTTNANAATCTLNGKIVASRALNRISSIRINAGAGDDDVTVNFDIDQARIPVTILGGTGNDSITGGAENDYIIAGNGSDTVDGGLGDDTIFGGAGNDLLQGGDGNDFINGDAGRDTLAGGLGNDSIVGGAGNDMLSGGVGNDTLKGADGNDVLRGGDGRNALLGGTGKDTVYRHHGDRYTATKTTVFRNDFQNNPLTPVTDIDALKQKFIDQAVARYQYLFGQQAWLWWRYPIMAYSNFGVDAPVAMSDATGGAGTGAASADHSGTNNQVSGVNEADIVQTDGNYIYLVQNGELDIVNAWPADQSHIVSRTTLDGWGTDLYLDGSHLTTISTKWVYDDNSGWNPGYGWPLATTPTTADMADIAVGAPIGGMMWWRPSKPEVVVTVYDVTDPTAPSVVSTTTLDGNLSSSRDINGKIYVVLDQDINLPSPLIVPVPADTGDGTTGDAGAGSSGDGSAGATTSAIGIPIGGPKYVYESEEAYRARLEAMDINTLLPGYTVTIGDTTTTGSLVDTSKFYAQQTVADAYGMFSVVTIDANNATPQPIDTTSLLGCSGDIFMSQDSLYVTSTTWNDAMGQWSGDLYTDIYQFAVTDSGVNFEAAGQVPGWTLNSYSMDESNGYFHIATTTDNNDTTSNNIYVLQDQGGTLQVTGGIQGLALSERIYAARFVGDQGYLVTYHQVDPLFTIDLTDPAAPFVAGQLDMPGYSSYLQPIDSNLIFGIGRDVNSSNNEPDGLKISLFDVSTFADPTLVDTFKFVSDTPAGENAWWYNWTSSPAEWDPHAISYFPDQQILAVPVLDWGWWNNDAKLELLKVDSTGFTEVGQVHHDGEVLRSLRIGNFVYSIGTDAIKVISLDDPSTDVADVPLPAPDPVVDPTPVLEPATETAV